MTDPTWCSEELPCATAMALREQLADMTDQRDLAIRNFEHNHDEWLAMKAKLAEAKAALDAIEDAWVSHTTDNGEDYDEGYDDGLKEACDIARAALAKMEKRS